MTRDELATLERALREAEPPDAGAGTRAGAADRARPGAGAAAGAACGAARLGRGRRRCSLALVVTQRDSGPGAGRRAAGARHRQRAEPAPAPVSGLALPASGRLLVTGSDGLFVVARDGRRTRLGRWDDATWSPAGLFVGATAGHTLAALDPADGTVRWRLRPGGLVEPPALGAGRHAHRLPRRRQLRIVYGNGTHDVAGGAAHGRGRPAWRPERAAHASPGPRPTGR